MTNMSPLASLVLSSAQAAKLIALESALTEALARELHEFTFRIANAEQGYTPSSEESEMRGISTEPPTLDEARALFGRIYVALKNKEDKAFIRAITEELAIPLTQPAPDLHDKKRGRS